MAFYEKAKPRKMTKQDHLRAESNWEEEGTRYRKNNHGSSTPSANTSSGYGKPSAYHGNGNRSGNSGHKPAYPPAGNGFSHPARDQKFHKEERPRPEIRPEIHPEARPAPVPAPAHEKEYRPAPEFNTVPENLLSGRNPIREALKAGRDIEKLLVAKGELSGSAREIVAEARERHIPVQIVERTRLDEITRNHQGMLAFASAYHYSSVEEMLAEAAEKGEAPFLVVLDGVTDPMNLGAIIRTAACVGAHGVIVPERRAAGLTPTAVKASAGAIEVVKVARVTNLNRTLDMLKQCGVWLYAADMKGQDFRKVDFSGPAALIIGGEGEGISRLTLDRCDRVVSIPMSGKLDSLNASVAAGVLMYAVMSGR